MLKIERDERGKLKIVKQQNGLRGKLRASVAWSSEFTLMPGPCSRQSPNLDVHDAIRLGSMFVKLMVALEHYRRKTHEYRSSDQR
jgi:hypothetical protein